MKKLWLLVSVMVLAGCSSHAHLVKQQWHEIESDHFRILTDASPDKVESLARELERFRIATGHLLNLTLTDEEKFTIVALKDRLSYEAMVSPASAKNTAGYFSDTLYGRYALLNLNGYSHLKSVHDNWSRQLLYHEYTHYLVARGSRFFTYPYWFEEGFAEFLATAVCDEAGKCLYGSIPVDRALTLSHYGHWNLEKLLTATRSGSSDMQKFQVYASGWLLTHMLMTNGEGRGQLAEYLNAVHAGSDPLKAVEEVFGVSVDALDKQYREYGRKKMTAFALTLGDGYGEISIRTRALEPARAMTELAKVLALKKDQRALQQLRRYAVEEGIDTRQLEYSIVFAALQSSGPETVSTEHPETRILFEPGFDQTYETGASDDYWPRLVYAETLVRKAQQQPESRADLLSEACYLYKSIVERDNSVAAAWFGLGITAAHSRIPAATYHKYFWQAYDLSPQSEPAALALLHSLQEAQMRDEFVRYGKLIIPVLSESDARQRLTAAVKAVESNKAMVVPPTSGG